AGSTIEFQVAGGCGLGTLDAAKEKHVWGIGVDADQSYLGPHVLTSATKRVDEAVFLTVKDVIAGKFRGGRNAVFGLKQNGGGLVNSLIERNSLIVPALRREEDRLLLDLGFLSNLALGCGCLPSVSLRDRQVDARSAARRLASRRNRRRVIHERLGPEQGDD